MGYNDLADNWSPRGAFLISNTFARRHARHPGLGRLQRAPPATRKASARCAGTAATAPAASARRSATCRSTRRRAAPIAAAIRTFPASRPGRACPTRRATRPSMTRPRWPRNVHPAPAALRPADARPAAARRHRSRCRRGPGRRARSRVDVLYAKPAGDPPGGLPRGDLVQPHRRAGRQAADQRRPGRLRCQRQSALRRLQRRRHPLGIPLRPARHQILAISAPVGPAGHGPPALHLARPGRSTSNFRNPVPDHHHARCAQRQRLYDRFPATAAASPRSPIRST